MLKLFSFVDSTLSRLGGATLDDGTGSVVYVPPSSTVSRHHHRPPSQDDLPPPPPHVLQYQSNDYQNINLRPLPKPVKHLRVAKV